VEDAFCIAYIWNLRFSIPLSVHPFFSKDFQSLLLVAISSPAPSLSLLRFQSGHPAPSAVRSSPRLSPSLPPWTPLITVGPCALEEYGIVNWLIGKTSLVQCCDRQMRMSFSTCRKQTQIDGNCRGLGSRRRPTRPRSRQGGGRVANANPGKGLVGLDGIKQLLTGKECG